MRQPSVVTGVGLAVTGLATGAGLNSLDSNDGGFDSSVDLGGPQMRHKDRASRLALRSVERAFADVDRSTGTANSVDHATTATVVSSNYGNLDTVCEFTDRIAEVSTAGLSPLGLPHVSSNAIAGWIAIRHGLRGPNITLCNGRTSGIDALYWADNLIGAGRADVVVVVGVEPDTRQVRRLLSAGPDAQVLDGAAAVILESEAHAANRQARARAVLGSRSRATDIGHVVAAFRDETPVPGLWLTPSALPPDISPLISVLDLTQRLGECSGALGVLQCVAAIAHLDSGDPGPIYATCGGGPRGDLATLQFLRPRDPATTPFPVRHHSGNFPLDQEGR
ncbi:beta-ketoacyl synthase N-terminal-like domain-containing protein [Nocardia sp. NPDC049190]|uniref:beta-ketoacyl synthase N-terminal-like domain-containing protein n=1 Tax=Nocardia sp. NPDC049190 TaxID=3155650 RepID=UPI0033C3CAC6